MPTESMITFTNEQLAEFAYQIHREAAPEATKEFPDWADVDAGTQASWQAASRGVANALRARWSWKGHGKAETPVRSGARGSVRRRHFRMECM
jgi:hypothetical protein